MVDRMTEKKITATLQQQHVISVSTCRVNSPPPADSCAAELRHRFARIGTEQKINSTNMLRSHKVNAHMRITRIFARCWVAKANQCWDALPVITDVVSLVNQTGCWNSRSAGSGNYPDIVSESHRAVWAYGWCYEPRHKGIWCFDVCGISKIIIKRK